MTILIFSTLQNKSNQSEIKEVYDFDDTNEFSCYEGTDILIYVDLPRRYKVDLLHGFCVEIIDNSVYSTQQTKLPGEYYLLGAPDRTSFQVRCFEAAECMIEKKVTLVYDPNDVNIVSKKIKIYKNKY